MKRSTRIASLVSALLLAAAAQSHAAITPMGSVFFPYKFEMNNVGEGLDPAGSTAEFTRGAGGSFTADPLNGYLHVDTMGAVSNAVYWDSNTWAGAVSPSTGWTVEIRVRLDNYLDVSAENRGFYWLSYTQSGVAGIYLAPTATYFTDAIVDTPLGGTVNNTDDYHTFRIAKDTTDVGGTPGFQVWRDEVQIGTNENSTFPYNAEDFYFGDGSSSVSGAFSIDYVRWTPGAFTVPEPASAALLGFSALLMLSRRRK
jgi:hypothetical protein